MKEQWENLRANFGDGEIHFIPYQKRRGKKQFFLCYDRPLYDGPGKQLKDYAKGNFNYVNTITNSKVDLIQKSNFRILNSLICSTFLSTTNQLNSEASSSNNPETIMNLDVEGDTIDLTDTAAVSPDLQTRTQNDIAFALQLDLTQSPRIARSGDKEILLHDRKYACDVQEYGNLHSQQMGMEQ